MQGADTLLRDIHRVELDILDRCATLCEKYHIPYYLCYGSLLGAVRHRGFIPWDDDIDIMMPVEAIPVFKKHFMEEYREPYFYSDIDTEKTCTEPWPKIRNSHTTSMPRAFSRIEANWGICIDIFPLYPISDNALLKKGKKVAFRVLEVLLRASTAGPEGSGSWKLRMVSGIPYGIRKGISKWLMAVLAHGSRNSRLVFDGLMVLNRSDIMGEKTMLPFEDREFAVPNNYHQYLTNAYGDYMQPPPESERTGHAGELGEIIWDTEKSYRAYQEDLK